MRKEIVMRNEQLVNAISRGVKLPGYVSFLKFGPHWERMWPLSMSFGDDHVCVVGKLHGMEKSIYMKSYFDNFNELYGVIEMTGYGHEWDKLPVDLRKHFEEIQDVPMRMRIDLEAGIISLMVIEADTEREMGIDTFDVMTLGPRK